MYVLYVGSVGFYITIFCCYRELCSEECGPAHLPGGDIGLCLLFMHLDQGVADPHVSKQILASMRISPTRQPNISPYIHMLVFVLCRSFVCMYSLEYTQYSPDAFRCDAMRCDAIHGSQRHFKYVCDLSLLETLY